MWNTAGKAGLALGGLSTAYLFLTQWIGQAEMPAFISIVLNMLLWAVKFGGCIWLMMFFMKKFVAESRDRQFRHIQARNGHGIPVSTRIFGVLLCQCRLYQSRSLYRADGHVDAADGTDARLKYSGRDGQDNAESAADHFLLESDLLFHLWNNPFLCIVTFNSKQRPVRKLQT